MNQMPALMTRVDAMRSQIGGPEPQPPAHAGNPTYEETKARWANPASTKSREVQITEWWPALRGTNGYHTWLTNGAYQPELEARTGAFTLFRLGCVSTTKLCAFQIVKLPEKEGEEHKIVPFWHVASDGITHPTPTYKRNNGNWTSPGVQPV